MVRINFSEIKRAATQAAGDAKLRLSVTDGSVKTSKHGFMSRAVRAFFGPTKKDLADNNRLMGSLLASLKEKYGEEIGVRAFLAARPEARFDGQGIEAKTGKGLTARQVKVAIAYAEAAQSEQFRSSARAQADVFRPGTPYFDLVAEKAGINPAHLSVDQKKYYQSRLREKVIGLARHSAQQPVGSEVLKLAEQALKHTANNVGGNAASLNASHRETTQAASRLLTSLSRGGGDPAQALLDFTEKADGLVDDWAWGGGIGGDEQLQPRLVAMDNAVAKLGKRQAKAIYEKMMAPDGSGRQALLAMTVATDRMEIVKNPHKAGASADMTQALISIMGALAKRAGIDFEQHERTTDAIESAKMDGPETNGIPNKALTAADVKDAKGVSRMVPQFDQAMDERAKILARRIEEDDTSMAKDPQNI